MELDYKLTKEISSYCSLNGLDEKEYVNSLLKKAFMVDKYGDRPPLYGSKAKNDIIIPEVKEEKEINYILEVEFAKKEIKKRGRKPKIVEEKEEVNETIFEKEEKKSKKRKLSAK